jgi:hypothetical protein
VDKSILTLKRDRILPLMAQYPLQAGPLYTAYKDLALAVEWQDLRIVPLQGTEWVCIVGHKRKEVSQVFGCLFVVAVGEGVWAIDEDHW